MGKGSRWLGLVVSLALIVVMTVGTISAQASSIYRVGKYDFYYNNPTELNWAKGLAKYALSAWKAAYSVIPKYSPQIQVRFTRNISSAGQAIGGTQKVYLNPNLKNLKRSYFATMGGTLAHETSHILFFNYTMAVLWRSDLKYYRTFLTESLAYYTGNVVYAYGPKYRAGTVKSRLKYYANRAFDSYEPMICGKGYLSWYGMGYYYQNKHDWFNGGSDAQNTAWWGFHAAGYFLTGGKSSRVPALLRYMKTNVSSAKSWRFFEDSFKAAYNCYANASGKRWDDYGHPASMRDKKFLMGQFYNQWYL